MVRWHCICLTIWRRSIQILAVPVAESLLWSSCWRRQQRSDLYVLLLKFTDGVLMLTGKAVKLFSITIDCKQLPAPPPTFRFCFLLGNSKATQQRHITILPDGVNSFRTILKRSTQQVQPCLQQNPYRNLRFFKASMFVRMQLLAIMPAKLTSIYHYLPVRQSLSWSILPEYQSFYW